MKLIITSGLFKYILANNGNLILVVSLVRCVLIGCRFIGYTKRIIDK